MIYKSTLWAFVVLALFSSSVKAAGNIGVVPSSLDFGSVNVGNTTTANLVITNLDAAGSGLTISSASLAGGSSPDFSPGGTFPFVLVAGESAVLPVEFSPTSAGAKTATLVIVSDDPDDPTVLIPLSGTGLVVCDTVTATASGGGTITKGAVSLLKGSGGAACAWSPATGLIDANSCNALAAPEVTTTYSLTVMDGNNCASENDATVTVEVVDIAAPPSGSILELMKGVTPPPGYTFLGEKSITLLNGKARSTLKLDVYRRN